MTPKIEIKPSNNKQFYARLVANNNKIVAVTETYKRFASAENAAKRMQQLVPTAKIVNKVPAKKS